ncbi:MAG: mannose-1-phosphate guanylyltransferase/mannose-6-phosphate isomerase [Cytophagales bacterium]|nr:mannose-1-phosphate guanylyltransferase/mannose-6-phosphate isomerase [Cytophagales bacterium]
MGSFSLLPVILCGGSGTRLWPLSRESYPKQFHRFIGANTLFEDTVIRAVALLGTTSSSAEIAIVCNETHRFMAAEQAARVFSGKVHIILEPAARNTAPAIAAVAHLFTNKTLVVLPSDHYMPTAQTLVHCVNAALPATVQGYLVTFGITPTSPETGYGYIAAGQLIQDLPGISKVAKFLEKPNLEVAKTLLASGTHTWNSGMFVMRAADFLSELKTYAPAVFEATQTAAAQAKFETDFVRLDKAAFESSPSISVDYAVFEHTTQAAVTPFNGTWSDLGSWSAVADLASNNSGADDAPTQHVQIDSSSNHIHASKPVALVGVNDLVIVDTEDALLITHKANSQQVKDAMALLAKRTPDLAKNHRKVQRPWGWYDSLDVGTNHQVKRIMVKPGASISLQTHEHRAEHWVIIKGEAQITLGKEVKTYQRYEHVFIPKQCLHRLQNVSKTDVELIEVQCGDYLGEDDIVRYEDVYGRVATPK